MTRENNMNEIRKIIIFIFTLFSITAFGQLESINKFNSSKKKTGYWKVFLDENTNPTDSSKATFYGYDLYENGKSPSKFKKKGKYLGQGKTTFDGKIGEKGKPELLDGTFLIYNKRGNLIEETKFKDGSYFLIKLYSINLSDSSKNGLAESIYFNTESPGSIYFEEFNNDKLTRKIWVYSENNKWKTREIKYK